MSRGRTNAGCGNTQPFAAIAVTYIEGAIVTCTDGVVSLGAKNSNGRWIFNIPYTGKWTIHVINGIDLDKMHDIEITSKGQVFDLIFNRDLVLFENGNENEGITGGWTIVHPSAGRNETNYARKENGIISIGAGTYTNDAGQTLGTSPYIHTIDKINATGSNKLTFVFDNVVYNYDNSVGGSTYTIVEFGLGSEQWINTETTRYLEFVWAAKGTISCASDYKDGRLQIEPEYTLDLSEVPPGEYEIRIRFRTHGLGVSGDIISVKMDYRGASSIIELGVT